ncbi:MAG: HAMP domain-containing protein, partial [Firmicutes bacterium]|nr:HAMP domain-containing protein [Bacillota bacterium]
MFYAGVGLALVLVVTTFQSVQVLSATVQELLDEWRSGVEHNAQYLQVQVEKDELLLGQLAAELASTEPVPSGPAPAAMRSTLRRLGVFRDGLFWVTPQGVTAASVPETVAPDAFLPALLSDTLPAPGAARRLSSLLRTRSGLPVVTLAVPMGRRGTLVAVADLQSGVLDDYLPFPYADGHAALIDPQGWVLASNEADLRYTQGEHPQWVANVRRQGRSTVGETSGVGGHKPHMMAFAPVGSTGWSLVFGEPASEALAARIRLIHGALLLGLLADIVVLIYAWWETGSLTGALRKLTAVTQQIAGGDLDAPVDVQRQDEIGALSRAFDIMRQRLNESRQELDQALTESQRRAQETTALYAVSRAILHPTGQEGALRTIVDRARELLCTAPHPAGRDAAGGLPGGLGEGGAAGCPCGHGRTAEAPLAR